jgi:hypothetical protein
MDTSANSVALVGLRHVLQDGVALLEGRNLRQDRADFVVQDLADLLQRANRGAQITNEHQLLVTAADIKSFEIYALLFQYLNDAFGNTLSGKIDEAHSALDELANHQELSPHTRDTTRDFFLRLIERMDCDEAYTPQSQPELVDLT